MCPQLGENATYFSPNKRADPVPLSQSHCRYTGPYYILLIVPVLMHGLGAMSLGPWAWWVLGALILFGSKLIWLVTESLWGRYTSRG